MSKKRQKNKQKGNRKRKQNIAREGFEALKQKVQSEALFGGQEVVFQSGSSEKMSETLLAFVEPYRQYATTRAAFERLIVIAAVAWNAAIFSPKDRQALLDATGKSIEESAGKDDVEVFKDLVNELVKRKERYFAGNKRLIASYQITEGKDKFHLAVASIG